jgi:predicted ester cyclase
MTEPRPRDFPFDSTEQRIRDYYACFNERRFADAAAFIADDAVLEQVPFHCGERGAAAYLLFAETWTRAFPDAQVETRAIRKGPGETYEVALFATGTHQGELSLGGCRFKPTGASATLNLREVLEFDRGRIVAACLSFDFQELAQQLARVDETRLLTHLEKLRTLEAQLRALSDDAADRRKLLNRIGEEIDAARRVVRPYFTR